MNIKISVHMYRAMNKIDKVYLVPDSSNDFGDLIPIQCLMDAVANFDFVPTAKTKSYFKLRIFLNCDLMLTYLQLHPDVLLNT